MGGTTCYAVTEAKSVIYHARNPSELSEHPDSGEIQVSAGNLKRLRSLNRILEWK